MSTTAEPRRLKHTRSAALLALAASVLALGAATAVVVGWIWAPTRGDWQAVVFWTYWCATPFLVFLSFAVARQHVLLKRVNLSLFGLWATVSLLLLLLPFLF